MAGVSLLTRGSSPVAGSRVAASSGSLISPPATRQRRTRWRDARLWLGVMLVVGSVLAGAKVLAAADDTTAVWQVVRDVPAGQPVLASDLRVTHVHFDETQAAAQYLSADALLTDGARASRDLRAGEMLAANAVSDDPSPLRRQLPLSVAPGSAPADLRAGDHVEVWAVADSATASGGAQPAAPSLVLPDVAVLSAGTSAAGVSGDRQVLVGLADDVDVGSVLAALTDARVVLVRLAG